MKFENVCLPITASGLLKNEANIDFVFASLLKCIQDPDLPVRVWAALTLREYLQYEKIRENLKPHVINVMQILLNLTNEIDMDTLSQVMETIAETYPNELVPFAIQLGTQLTASFLRIVEDLDMDDEEVEINSQVDKTMNAIGIMKTISTLVISLNESSSLLLGELEVVVSPVITTVLEKNLVGIIKLI